ncbi:MAG: YiiX/YebB-like N1pC/P60 family cysteine hydrolase [Ferruginibacter sp.]
MKKWKNAGWKILIALVLLYIVLLIPDTNNGHIIQAGKKPFFWNRDAVWQSMETNFINAKQLPQPALDSAIQFLKNIAENKLALIQNKTLPATDSSFILIENNFFILASFIAAKPGEVFWFTNYYNQFRNIIKLQSQQWNMKDVTVKNAMYTLLYGMRAAVEEVLLQTDPKRVSPVMLVQQEKSSTPFCTIFGIEVHSGDLLVSRGGAEVSALISRGNDYPGNFSHVALMYVEEKTNKPYLIEAHIEKGVAFSSVEKYINDKKLRFMVLRLQNNLPAMKQDSMLPQRAAKLMYDEASGRHIPYDFKMNFYDSSAMFCSEVTSYAYKKNGVQLWQNISTISSPGVVNWLHDFGVENFVTQMPSDLEYDPQLAVVAEWRDPETLYKDHIDNAAMDALLQKANNGEQIEYSIWMLPIARIIKGYSWIKNVLGKPGMIPEGMSATRALKNQTFVAMHAAVKSGTQQMAADFINHHGYRPPYWQLVKFAEIAANK